MLQRRRLSRFGRRVKSAQCCRNGNGTYRANMLVVLIANVATATRIRYGVLVLYTGVIAMSSAQVAQLQASILPHCKRKSAPVQVIAPHILNPVQVLVNNVCYGQWCTCCIAGQPTISWVDMHHPKQYSTRT